jgi:cell division protein FtsQ
VKPGAHPRYRQRGFASGLAALVSLFLATAAAIAWVGMGIVTSERWPIRWLEVNGAFQRISAEQLRASLAAQVGTSYFTVNLQNLYQAAARLPWVSAVDVRKQWPDTVQVTVQEYMPVAHWNRGQLISDSGTPFAVPEADEIQGLPWLDGPEERLAEVLETWVGLNEQLLAQGLEIAALRLDGRGAWSMVLDNGTHIQLGREATVERLQRLLASWASLTRGQEAPPLSIDLRYTNGFAVQWTGEPGTQPTMAFDPTDRRTQ